LPSYFVEKADLEIDFIPITESAEGIDLLQEQSSAEAGHSSAIDNAHNG